MFPTSPASANPHGHDPILRVHLFARLPSYTFLGSARRPIPLSDLASWTVAGHTIEVFCHARGGSIEILRNVNSPGSIPPELVSTAHNPYVLVTDDCGIPTLGVTDDFVPHVEKHVSDDDVLVFRDIEGRGLVRVTALPANLRSRTVVVSQNVWTPRRTAPYRELGAKHFVELHELERFLERIAKLRARILRDALCAAGMAEQQPFAAL